MVCPFSLVFYDTPALFRPVANPTRQQPWRRSRPLFLVGGLPFFYVHAQLVVCPRPLKQKLVPNLHAYVPTKFAPASGKSTVVLPNGQRPQHGDRGTDGP